MDPLYSTGNATQHSVMACVGKESKKEETYEYALTDSPNYIPETNMTLEIN